MVKIGSWEIETPIDIGVSWYESDGSTIVELIDLKNPPHTVLETIVLRSGAIRKIWGMSQNINIKVDTKSKRIVVERRKGGKR